MKKDFPVLTIVIDPHASHAHSYIIFDRKGEIIEKGHKTLVPLYKLMADPEYCIQLAIIEDQFIGVNPKSAINLIAARGELTGICKVLDIKYELVYPTQWQKTNGLKRGNAHNKVIRAKVSKLIGSKHPCLQNCYMMYKHITTTMGGKYAHL